MENTEAPRRFERAQTRLSTWPERTPFQKMLTAILIILLISGFIFGLRASPMIDNMSTPWEIVIFVWGLLFGAFYLISTANIPFSSGFKIVAVLGSGLTFVADGNALRESYVFSGVVPQVTQVDAPIIGSSNCTGLHSRPMLSVEPYPGKSISIKTTREICEEFEPRKLDGHECVRLEIETGRYGIRRMLAPLSTGAC